MSGKTLTAGETAHKGEIHPVNPPALELVHNPHTGSYCQRRGGADSRKDGMGAEGQPPDRPALGTVHLTWLRHQTKKNTLRALREGGRMMGPNGWLLAMTDQDCPRTAQLAAADALSEQPGP